MLSERWDMLAIVDHMSDANLRHENRGLTQVMYPAEGFVKLVSWARVGVAEQEGRSQVLRA